MGALYDLVRVSTATTGTGTITLGTTVNGFKPFPTALDGKIVSYAISDGLNSESGEGTYTVSNQTLTRTVKRSTNNDNAINLSGAAQVMLTPNAADFFNNGVKGADIASASTIDLTSATGDMVDVTGTTAITGITLREGFERTVRFTGVLTLTNGASLVLPGGVNIATAAGDFAVFRGYAGGVVRCVSYTVARQSIFCAPFDALAYSGMQVNGACEVDQPNGGSSVSVGTGTVNANLIDGWSISKTGTSAVAVQRTASVFAGYNNEIKVTVSTAQASIGSDFVRLHVPIEGYRFRRVAWGTASAQPITVGFKVKSSVAGTLVCTVSDGISVELGASGSQTVSAATEKWVTYTFPAQSTWAGATTNGVGLVLIIYVANSAGINGVSSTSNTFELTGLVILPGIEFPSSDRAPFIMRPYTYEIGLCRRYYESGIPVGFYSGATQTGQVASQIIRIDQKRATPTISFSGGTPTNVSSESADEISAQGFRYTLQASANQVAYLGRTAKADARL